MNYYNNMGAHLSYLFEYLMTTPIKIYQLQKTTTIIGTQKIEKVLIYTTCCNFHSLSIDRAEFRDKIGTRFAYLVCLPLSIELGDPDDYIFEIENKEFQLIGVRQASRRLENICEVVDYD